MATEVPIRIVVDNTESAQGKEAVKRDLADIRKEASKTGEAVKNMGKSGSKSISVLRKAAKLLPGAFKVIGKAVAVAAALGVAALVILRNKIKLTADGSATLGDLWKVVSTDFAKGAANMLSSMLGLGKGSKKSFSDILLSAGETVEKMIKMFRGAAKAIPVAFENIPVLLKAIFQKTFNGATSVVQGALNLYLKGVSKFSNLVTGFEFAPKKVNLDKFKIDNSSVKNLTARISAAYEQGASGDVGIVKYLKGAITRAEILAVSAAKKAGKSTGKAYSDGLRKQARVGAKLFTSEMTDAFKEVKNTLGSIMGSLENTLVDFVTKGKASFKDLANSIIADMTRLVIKQAITKPLQQGLSTVLGSVFNKPQVYGPQQPSSGKSGGGAFAGLGKLFGFATGGSFQVGGVGGQDSKLIQFMATPGELVNVQKGPQASNDNRSTGSSGTVVYNIDARGADVGIEARIMNALKQVSQSIEPRAARIVQDRTARDPYFANRA